MSKARIERKKAVRSGGAAAPRPKSAAALFSIEARAKIVKANPARGADPAGLARAIEDMWQNLPPAEKATYEKRALKGRERRDQALAAWSARQRSR